MMAHVEYTDLFCGEANYAWGKRFEFDCTGMTDLQVIHRAKSELCIRSRKAVRSTNQCDLARYFNSTVMFISFSEL